MFIPFINKLVDNISKKEYERLLIFGLIFLILIPSVVIYSAGINEGIYLFYYYLVGGYIRLYRDDIKGGIKYLLGFLFMYMGIVFVTLYIGKLSYINPNLIGYVKYFSKSSSILVFMSSICLFLFFKGLKLGNNKVINFIASTFFGVYLFHEHRFVRGMLWGDIFSFDRILMGKGIFIKAILVSLLVYLLGSIVDVLRQYIFKYFNKMIKIIGWNKYLN